MMVAKFTPGPWHANWTRLNGKAIGFHVADETHGSIRPICEFYDGTEAMPPEEVEAHARLIAAAPELLEALQSIAEYWNRDQNETAMADACWHAIETAMAAITKATGDQQ